MDLSRAPVNSSHTSAACAISVKSDLDNPLRRGIRRVAWSTSGPQILGYSVDISVIFGISEISKLQISGEKYMQNIPSIMLS